LRYPVAGEINTMASITTGRLILERLAGEWGVWRIYGYPGDGTNGILGGFHEVGADVARVRLPAGGRPEVPPLPPHIRFEQVKELSSALRAGDPAAPRFMKQSLRGKPAEILTR
jgi:hypothetical protein